MSSTFGLTAAGFNQMRQADWQADLEAAWTAQFGNNVNLDPRSNNGQLIGIMAERLALLSEGLEQVYTSQYPGGAEGVSVDNLLALIGQQRLPAQPAVTQPTPLAQANGVTLYGLLLGGVPGTLVPAGSLVADTASPPNVFATNAAATIAAAANAVQLVQMSNTPTTGSFTLAASAPSGALVTSAPLSFSATAQTTQLTWATAPTTGTFTLSAGSTTLPAQPYNVTAAALAAALSTALSLPGISASGSQATGITVSWPAGAIPLLSPSSDAGAPAVTNPLQAALNGLTDPATGLQFFSDVAVTGAAPFTVSYGANPPASGAPSSAGAPQPLLVAGNNTLQAGTVVTNITVLTQQQGAAAQVAASATCTATGPRTVKAGTLTQIQTPVAGWTSVTNQLDCIPGSDAETDTQAMLRRSQLLAGLAQGPLAAVQAKVLAVAGVTAAQVFSNTSNAAQQVVSIAAGASSGTYQLFLAGGSTPPLPYNASAAQVQAGLRAIAACGNVTVTGNPTFGYTVDLGGAAGGQAVPLMVVANNSTGAAVTVAFGRAPKSLEVVVSGGDSAAVARAIYQAAPSGISSYGAPVLNTTGSVAAGSTTMTVSSAPNLQVGLLVSAYGVPQGTQITAISGNTLTLSNAAMTTYSNAPAVFGNGALLQDSNGNPVLIAFSRPSLVPVYVALSLVTDTYQQPGNPASGRNPAAQFSAASVPTLQSAITTAINAVPVGGTLVGLGSGGLLLSFAAVPGIVSFTMSFDVNPNPTGNANISLLPGQQAYGQQALVQVSYT